MNYEDIWQIQDEITAAVNSLGFSLWDLHYDRSSFSFHMELNEHRSRRLPVILLLTDAIVNRL